ncbi:Fis family transcriptional regulator [Mycobacterium avium subsp. hominissuis]|nr:Fis family transcriptional regulator [Mycobacterium avium subsp. hominissuis]ATO72717.2 Fis family transcriptional regulator [Mycobacterium avium subsp. hominissuis]ETA99887.1 Fis family transcriptional regulator [Mycobacterium avium 10-5581]
MTAVEIEQLTVRDKDVVREAQRWTDGERGKIVDDPDVLGDADLTAFVTEAIKIGAHALSATGQAQDARVLERMMKEVGEKAADTSAKAAEVTERAVKSASDAVGKAAENAKKAITDADKATRRELQESTKAAVAEVRRLFGGQNPEVVERLMPVLEKFGADLDAKAKSTFSELHAKAVKQLDPSDPTSPMAKVAVELTTHQRQLSERIDQNHSVLTERINELATALKVREARNAITRRTPKKGVEFEDAMTSWLLEIAAGLGDEYSDTRNKVGVVSRCQKGDGVVSVEGGAARVVVEMTDSATGRDWHAYFDMAERNREAHASLGIVPTAAQNGEQSIRVLGARRIVLAFDPAVDDPALLRTVVMLVRAAALAASSRRGAEQLATAEEKITEAVGQLEKLDDVKKNASAIQKNASKIESVCTTINAGIHRLLTDALAALAEASPEGSQAPGAVA